MVANLSSIGGLASSGRRFSASFMPPRAPNETGPVTHEESNALGSDFISFDQSDESHVEESESEPGPVVVTIRCASMHRLEARLGLSMCHGINVAMYQKCYVRKFERTRSGFLPPKKSMLLVQW